MGRPAFLLDLLTGMNCAMDKGAAFTPLQCAQTTRALISNALSSSHSEAT